MNLELMALRWLLYEKKCAIALCERSPRQWSCGEPDALGITKARYLIEIEIKRTLSDFRADRLKASRRNRDLYLNKAAKQFYYLVPEELCARVEPIVPEWAGLMRGPKDGEPSLSVLKTAPVNHDSQRLSIKECSKLVRMVANFSMTVLERHQSAIDRFKEGAWRWPEPDYEI